MLHLPPHRPLHCAQVDREVRGVRNETSVGTEQSATEVESLLDVGGDGGALEGLAHLLCNAHEAVLEDGEADAVPLGASPPRGAAAHLQLEVARGAYADGALGLHHDGGGLVQDHGRAVQRVPRPQVAHVVHRRRLPSSRKVHLGALYDGGGGAGGLHVRVRGGGRQSDGPDADVVDEDGLSGGEEAELSLVALEEGAEESARVLCSGRALESHQSGVGTVVSEVEKSLGANARGRESVVPEVLLRLPLKSLCLLLHSRPRLFAVHLRRRLRPLHRNLRQAKAIGRENARVLVHKHPPHAQQPRNRARVLRPRPAKRRQHVVARAVSLGFGDVADGSGHCRVCDVDEAHRHLLGCQVALLAVGDEGGVDFGSECVKRLRGGLGVEGLVLAGPEDVGEVLGQNAAEEEVGVRHGQPPAALAVAHGARLRPDRLGADLEHARLERQHRAAACRDGLDVQLRCLHRHTRRFCVVDVTVDAVVAGNISGRAAHVEADDSLLGGSIVGGLREAHHPSSWP
mmetsp:Transcript_2355/g.8378  ORF Transcript_2355/g.8378 Transcript_2355/m.8378 type:complete len:515 (+) Transcript_2355:1483-3027(+)